MKREDLLELKEKIEKGQKELAEIKGQKTMLMQQLKKDFGCATLKEAEKLLSRQTKDIEKLNEDVNKGMEELENEYPVEGS